MKITTEAVNALRQRQIPPPPPMRGGKQPSDIGGIILIIIFAMVFGIACGWQMH
jgi:hypothetical protein